MALARIKVWIAETLTFTDLNTEFNNVLDNALSLISPLTADLNFNGNDLNNLSTGTAAAPGLNFNGDTDSGLYVSAANSVGVTAGGASVVLTSTSGMALQNNQPVVPAAVSGVPAQHGLFRDNVVKAWAAISVTPALQEEFNVASVADGGAGVVTVTWDRDFANTNYAVAGTAMANDEYLSAPAASQAVGSAQIRIQNFNGTLADQPIVVMAIGDQ